MDHTMNSFFATVLENSSPTLVTDINGSILYINRPSLCLLERCRPFKKPNSNIVNDDPEPSSFKGSHYTSVFEPLDPYEATSLRNHFTNNVQILSKRTRVCRTIKCRTFSSKRPIMLEFSTRTCTLPEFFNTDNYSSIGDKNSTIHSSTKNNGMDLRNSFVTSTSISSSIDGKGGIDGEKGDEGGGEGDDDENEQFFDAIEYSEDDNLDNNNNIEEKPNNNVLMNHDELYARKDLYSGTNSVNLEVQLNSKTEIIADSQVVTVVSSTPVSEGSKNLILISTIRDVTDSKFQEFVLSEADYRMSITYDVIGVITEVSRSCKSILGFEPDELLGNDGYTFIHPDDATKVRTFHAKRAVENYGTTLQRQAFRHQKKDGSYCLLEIWSQGLQPDGSWSFVGFDISDSSVDNHNNIPDQTFIRKLLPKNVEAESRDKAANNFVSFICHELRNPLNGIIGFTSLILDTTLTDQQREFAESISSISNYMCNVINQSIDLCQTQSHGTTSSEIVLLRLNEIVKFGFLTVTVLARTKGTELIFQDHLTPLQIKDIENKWYGDEDIIRKILLNYLTNAIKHTGSGTVTVRLEIESDKLLDDKEGFMAKCSVQDTGPGIPQKDLKRLFLPYSKLVSSFGEIKNLNEGTKSPNHQQSQRSSGLGLSICKELADKMGGKVGVESVLGKGSTFWFTFPVYTNVPEDIDDDSDTTKTSLNEETSSGQSSGSESLYKRKSIKDVPWTKQFSDYSGGCIFENGRKNLHQALIVGDTNSIHSSSSSTSSAPSSHNSTNSSNGLNCERRRKHKKPAKVLMVEDNEMNQRIALKYLEKMGEKVTIAANGIEALEKMKNETFDILFVDLQMPFMDGYALARRIREAEKEAEREICQCDSQDCELLLPHNAPVSSTPPPTPPGLSSAPTNGHPPVISLIKSPSSLHIHTRSSSILSSISSMSSSSSSSSSNFSSSSSSDSSSSSYSHSQLPSPTTSSSGSGLSTNNNVTLKDSPQSALSPSSPTSPPISPPSSHKRLKHVPIVACTANVLDEEKGRCRQHGMDGFLSKPYAMEAMKKCIEELVEDDEESSGGDDERNVECYNLQIKQINDHYDNGYEQNLSIAPI